MGNFSRSTFDPRKHYVGVRLQQGVPLVDADWNEMEDIRRYELESLLGSVVGDGVPAGNTGFQIAETDADNDFLIKAGLCFVDGWIVVNDNDKRYTEQEPRPRTLSAPSKQRGDVVYLDVWEKEIGAGVDPDLVHEAIGVETCVRQKREWVVRVEEGASDLPEPPGGHRFYLLAVLTRTANNQHIGVSAISDRRRTGLAVLSDGISIKDGKVGIGVEEPEAALHVKGTAFASESLGIIYASKNNIRFTNHRYPSDDPFGLPPLTLMLVMSEGIAPVPYAFAIGHVVRGQMGEEHFEGMFKVDNRGVVTAKEFLGDTGKKTGYVVDYFVNGTGEAVEQGDVVVLADAPLRYWATGNDIPIPEVNLTDQAYDTRLCGIVSRVISANELPFVETGQQPQTQPTGKARGRKAKPAEAAPAESMPPAAHPFEAFAARSGEGLDRTKVEANQMGQMVTLGAYAHCKVDADIASIRVGDLLTSSPTKGHAQKVLDSTKAVGAILGKALVSLEKGKARVPVLVLLQ